MRVSGNESWYQERPEPEGQFIGTLMRHRSVAGPGAREALRYQLVRPAIGSIPVYAPGTGAELEPLLDQRVSITGKVIDLTSEGYGPELWIGWIDRASSGNGRH